MMTNDEKVLQRVFQEVDRNRDELLQAASELVQIPSVVGQETEAQRFMQEKYREMGLEVETFEANIEEIRNHPSYIDIPHPYEDRPNIIGLLKGSEAARSLILNGHVDVVSPEPLDRWTFDPWGGEVRDGKMYGRGVTDMKAGVMANLFALRAILNSGLKPKGTVISESVIEEEAGGSGGSLACFMRGYRAGGMLITEPSDLKVVVAHNGVKYFRVRVVGKTAHAALSHTGVNAIGKMNKIYDALIALDEKRAGEHPFPLVERHAGRSCNLNVGTYAAGDWASTVAGMAQMECRIGFVPGEKGDAVVKEVEETILRAAKMDAWLKEHPPTVQWYGWDTEPWVQDEQDPFIQAFLDSASPLLGRRPECVAFSGGLDTRFSPYFGIPSFAFGPRGGNIHGPDEYLEVDSLITLTKAIAKFVMDWCGYE